MKLPRFRLKIRKISPRRFLRVVLILIVAGIAVALGAVFGAWWTIRDSMPSVEDLESIRPKIITTIFDAGGQPIREFAEERRVEVPFAELPKVLINAIVATEDANYFRHKGIDLRGILRAIKEDVTKVLRGRRPEGGSTITQQLTRSLLLHRELSIRRKLKEWVLSIQIEKKYSKEKILELYCNHFFLGHGVYGVERAANLFFGKSVKDLTLEEAALIAGIFRGPSVYSPYNDPPLMLRRRNTVLNRMAEEGYVTSAEAEAAKQKPLGVIPLRRASAEFGAYFFEEVRKYLERTYGSEALSTGGLKVYTTLDPTLQKYAEDALRAGLRDWENARKGWRKDKPNLLDQGKDLQKEWLDSWTSAPLEVGEVADAIVLEATATDAVCRVKSYAARLASKEIPAWAQAKQLKSLIRTGDVIQVKVKTVDETKKEVAAVLDQAPVVQASLLAIDPRTGQIRAMVGGYSFRESQFNRAVQAPRPTGSAIKPFLYTAAIENGFTPATIVLDEPTTFIDKWNNEPWSPKNYDRQYKGAVTVRKGLEESRNVVTAKLLDYISPQVGVDYCRRFGITSTMYPYLSLSLGTFDVSLLELTSAFTAFPNKGVRIHPYFITRVEDRDGNVLEEARVESDEVISPQTAYIMTSMLQGVVQWGTAAAANVLEWPLGGKTGTTDKHTDAWYVGFSPSLCAGVWVGYDSQATKLGDRQSGAVVALPIWQSFFAKYLEPKKKELADLLAKGTEAAPEDFEAPPGLAYAMIDRKTGLLLSPICNYPLREVFFPGTEPVRRCTRADHMRILFYYAEEKATEH
jgi:penicillin-binding protein 1A